MKINFRKLFLFSFLAVSITATCQEEYIYTKKFTDKLQKFDLLFFEPTEDWLHPIPYKKDTYAKYDMVLVSEDESFEVRYVFQDLDHPLSLSHTPHLEFFRLVTNFASNQEEADIIIQGMDPQSLSEIYNADWGLFADFLPKRSLSSKKRGRAFALFKENKGLVLSLLLYDRDIIPVYFQLPFAFKLTEQ